MKRLSSRARVASSSRPSTGRRAPRSASPAASCLTACTTASSGRVNSLPSSRISPPASSTATPPSSSNLSASAFTPPSSAALGRATPKDQGVAVSPMATGTASMKTSSCMAGETKRRVRGLPWRTASIIGCRYAPRKSASVSASLRPTRRGSGCATRVVSWAVRAARPTPSGRRRATFSCNCLASRPMPRMPATRPFWRTGMSKGITGRAASSPGRGSGGATCSAVTAPRPTAPGKASRCSGVANRALAGSRNQYTGERSAPCSGCHQAALICGLLCSSTSSIRSAIRRSGNSPSASSRPRNSAVVRAEYRAPSK
ncbi:hypothetical protein D3C84_659030 [compost metagenome]